MALTKRPRSQLVGLIKLQLAAVAGMVHDWLCVGMGLSPALPGGGPRIVQPSLAMAVATASGVQAQPSGAGVCRSQPASRKARSRPPGAMTSRMIAVGEVTK